MYHSKLWNIKTISINTRNQTGMSARTIIVRMLSWQCNKARKKNDWKNVGKKCFCFLFADAIYLEMEMKKNNTYRTPKNKLKRKAQGLFEENFKIYTEHKTKFE